MFQAQADYFSKKPPKLCSILTEAAKEAEAAKIKADRERQVSLKPTVKKLKTVLLKHLDALKLISHLGVMCVFSCFSRRQELL